MELNHVFGLRGDIRGNVLYVDENTVIYPCGHVVVVLNTETRGQRFLPGSERSGGISALAVSPNKKFVAVAERGERATITVFDIASLKKRKILTCTDIQSKDIVNLSFSSDGKQLISQGGAPDWHMICWNWEKAKVFSGGKVSNNQGNRIICTDFCPWDNSAVCTYGDGVLKFIRIQDGTTKPIPFSFKREAQQYLCHAWLPEDRFVIATDTGELFLFESFEFRGAIGVTNKTVDPDKKKEENTLETLPIDSLVAYNKGFACGGAQNTLRVFEVSDDPHEYYRHAKTFVIDGKDARVMNLALSPSEDYLLCSLSSHQLYVLGLSNTDILKAEEMNFELLTTSVHGPFIPENKSGNQVQMQQVQAQIAAGGSSPAVITGLDCCMRKPFVATAGIDRVVRIWNYIEKTVVLEREFPDLPLSLAFHPSGLTILVGFPDKLRLMNLLMDDIRTYKEFPVKGSKDCKFSNGGQYFAAANGSVIQVYHTYTFESLLILRGHAGKVHSIGWTEDDRMLVSCGADGVIYRWSIKDGKKTGEYISKGSNLMCTRPSNDECTASLSTGKPDTRLTEIQLDSSSKFELIGPQGLGFDQICVSHSGKSVFAGLFDNTGSKMSKDGSENTVGSTVKLSLPLSSNQSKDSKPPPTADTHDKDGVEDTFGNVKEADNVYELQLDKLNRFAAHSGNITRMCVSHDDQYLFSVGDDGTLAIYLISEESDGSRKNREKEAMIQYAEEILVTKSDLEEKTNLMHELKTKVNELTLHNEYQLRLKDMNYNEKIKDVTKKFTEELDQDRSKYDKLRKEKLCMEDMFKDRLEKMESAHNNQLKTIEQTYQEKIDAEIKRFDELVQEREQLALRWDEQNHVLVESHEKYVNEVTEEFEDKLARELKERDQIEKKKQVLMNQFEDSKQEVEEDADIEIEELKEKYVAKLTVEREATLRLKGENGIMKKKFSSLQNDIEEQKDRIKQLTEREMDLYEGIKGLEKDIHGHKKEIKEREETIQDKEKRIYDLKKKNQELEKFKFVLDYKIKELKRQIEPRENEIADMRHQIKEMDLELEQYQKSNAALDLMIGELRLKIDGMQKEIDTQTEALEQGKLAADQCKLELHQAMQVLNDHHLLKNRVVEMYKSYIQSAADENGQPKEKKATKKDTDRDKQPETHTGASVQREYNRQREYLEKSVESLKRKLTKDMKMHQADKMRLLRESVDLTNEINTLRRELHSLKRSKVGTRTRKSHIVAELDTESKESTATRRTVPSPTKTSEASREIELQRQQIHALTQQVNRLEHGLGIK